MDILNLEKRNQILSEFKILKEDKDQLGTQKMLDIEKSVSNLVTTLPMKWMTESDAKSGKTVVGFLYNVGTGKYVNTDYGFKFIYANVDKISEEGALLFYIKHTPNNDLKWSIKAWDDDNLFFNWRTITGACKLYSSMDAIELLWSSSSQEVFEIYALSPKQYVGCWSNTDNELYVRKNIVNQQFKCQVLSIDKFNDYDKLIYNVFLKIKQQNK